MKKHRSHKPLQSLLLIVSLFMTGSFSSCNFLNVEDYFDDKMQYDTLFTRYEYLVGYMWGTTTMFPDESQIFCGNLATPGPMATDECFTSFASGGDAHGMNYVLGNIDADNIAGKPLNIWPTMYKIIRKCNTILSRKHEANLTEEQDEEITGYTHMIRGYAYYNLIQSYGPCILLEDEILPNNELPETYKYSRSTYDECVDYCCQELELAAKYLPIEVASTYFGRPTRGAAFALIARLRLQQASPLYNGGQASRSNYSNWKRSIDGINYINQTYNEKRWAVAAAACKRVIDMGIYKLHTVGITPSLEPRYFHHKNDPVETDPVTGEQTVVTVKDANHLLPEGVIIENSAFKGIDYYRSYAEMFNGETYGNKNPEFIWGKNADLTKFVRQCFPKKEIMNGSNGLCVTQKLVDAYYMIDGHNKENASEEYPYKVSHGVVTDDLFSIDELNFSGYKLSKGIYGMYQNRENRFYATVGFSGRYWKTGSNSQAAYGPFSVWFEEGGDDFTPPSLYSGKFASNENPLDYPSTGYLITKYIHPDDAFKGTGATVMPKYFAIIRYAEMLLGYAEALNHLTQNYTIELPAISGGNLPAETYTVGRNPAEIKKYFDQIRNRVGLPGLSDENMADETTLDEIIKREYMIEFACENRRYFDVRRWGIYEETEKEGIYGMHLGRDRSTYYLTPSPVDQSNNRNRVIDPKMILLPLPKAEVRRVETLDQNPGWEG